MKRKIITKLRTGSLPKSSFLIGVASIFDLYGSSLKIKYLEQDEDDDTEALFNDWKVVGEDLYTAKKKLDRMLGNEDGHKLKNDQNDRREPQLCP